VTHRRGLIPSQVTALPWLSNILCDLVCCTTVTVTATSAPSSPSRRPSSGSSSPFGTCDRSTTPQRNSRSTRHAPLIRVMDSSPAVVLFFHGSCTPCSPPSADFQVVRLSKLALSCEMQPRRIEVSLSPNISKFIRNREATGRMTNLSATVKHRIKFSQWVLPRAPDGRRLRHIITGG
jgi:hypothetical protein